MPQFQTVGIIAKQNEPAKVGGTLKRLVTFLRSRNREVFFDATSGAILGCPAEQVLDANAMGLRCSLAVAVGGDGTLLKAARAMAGAGVPLVGINLGRLGFLVDISPAEIETRLDEILSGAYDEEARSMLCARASGDSPPHDSLLALNDVVVHKWSTARMIEFETYINGVFVNAQRSDGIIVSTPTGSTAYALSGGGPLLHPRLDALVLVPICPHTLSNRPLVVDGSSRIEIRVCAADESQVEIACDGHNRLPIEPHARVRIERSLHAVRLLHPKGHDHYKILRAKLGWGGHPVGTRPC